MSDLQAFDAHERSSTPPAPAIRVCGEVVSGVGVRKKPVVYAGRY
jgi:hypothetical protein